MIIIIVVLMVAGEVLNILRTGDISIITNGMMHAQL